MSLKVLILGVNGFIGNSLTERILQDTDWEVYGMDMASNRLRRLARQSALPLRRGRHHHQPLMRSSTTSRNATWCCRWWRSPRPRLMCRTRCACSNSTSRPTCTSCASACATRSACCSPRPPMSMACARTGSVTRKIPTSCSARSTVRAWIGSCSKQLLGRVIAAYGQQQGYISCLCCAPLTASTR